jgi:ankyrin repeat protein
MRILISSLLLMLLACTVSAKATDDLFKAIYGGDLPGVKAAIADKANVNAFDDNGNTPLLTAVWNTDMVQELIAAKADVNKYASNKFMNPILSAASWGEPQTIALLVAAGADVNARDLNGNTPLFYAAFMSASVPTLEMLISKGADVKALNNFNQNVLMHLAANGRSAEKRVEQLKLMAPYIEKAGVKMPEKYKNPQLSDFSSLEDRIAVLLKAGLGIDDETLMMVPPTVPNADKMNKTAKKLELKQWPLFDAMDNMFDRANMVKALLAKGADPKKEFGANKFNWNLLHAMCIKGALNPTMVEETADALIKAGVNMNQKDLQGYTPLIKAAKEGNTGIAAALVKNGADLNVVEKETTTDSHFDGYGTTFSVKKTWRTARDWAAETKHPEVYKIIEDAGGKDALSVMK